MKRGRRGADIWSDEQEKQALFFTSHFATCDITAMAIPDSRHPTVFATGIFDFAVNLFAQSSTASWGKGPNDTKQQRHPL